MGVDYSGVGGIGIEISEEMKDILLDKHTSENEDDEVYFSEVLDDLGIEYQEAGSGGYGGEARYYFLVKGNKLSEVQENTPAFIESLKDVGIKIDVKDLRVVSDLYIR